MSSGEDSDTHYDSALSSPAVEFVEPQPVPHAQPGVPIPAPQWGYYTPQWLPQHLPQQHPPQGPPGAPVPGLPMSPRGQQPPLHAPGTPTLAPAMPPTIHPPHSTPSPHTHTSSLSNVSSTPPTPASSTAPGGGLSRLNSNANTFTPKRVTIKSESGQEVDLEQWKKQAPAAVASPVTPSSPARRTVQVRLETEEAEKKRLAEEEAEKAKKEAERAKKEGGEKARKEAEEKAKRESESPEVVDGEVRSLLSKLTMERFDSISDQIIALANRSEKEKDGRTLIQVIRLVYEKGTDGEMWSEICARLCRKMMEQISPKVQDDEIRNTEGRHIAGGQLFRKYLLNHCQEDFERGWVAKEATAAAAATKASKDQAAKAAAEQSKDEEQALYSEEYYAAQKAKRQGLGLIKFIGELFKLQMLTERIMHECVKKLLGNAENPEEEEIESLCKFLTTVGQILDTQKARAHMNVYFSRMKELAKSPNVNSHMQFMLQDIIELRERKWIPRNAVVAPTMIAAIHEQAVKEQPAQEKEAFTRLLSMFRGGSRPGGERSDHAQIGPDGWAVAGGAATRPASKAGDLSKFGKIDKSAPMTFGPSSVFRKGDESKSSESTIRQGSTNTFSMPYSNPSSEAAGKSSRPPSSIDWDEGDEKLSGSGLMSEAEARARIEQDVIEFFAIRDLGEAETYFAYLPSRYKHLLVDRLVMRAVESKAADAQLVADLFERAVARGLCTPAAFEEGFAPTAEIIDDIAIDAPKAPDLFATMIKGAGLHVNVERRTRLASKSMDGNRLVRALLGAARHRISTEAANELIERSVVLLSDLHDVQASLAVFDELPRSYHSQLVDKLVSEAMEPGTHPMRAQVLAYFFGWAVERRLCSTAAFEEGVWSTTSALENIAVCVPDALERYTVVVKAMGLHEDPIWRAQTFEKVGCHGPKLAALFSVI